MAEFMNKNLHATKIPSAKKEINRLTALLETPNAGLRKSAYLLTLLPAPTEQMVKQDNYHKAVIKLINTKIMAWEQFVNYEKNENILDLINETMDEWLQTGWLYFGQDKLKEESEDAIDEYQMFKILLSQIPNKPKKPRRRGGKKHKKKKQSVWDEVM